MPFSPTRRTWLWGLSALALGGCATDANLATSESEATQSLAELPLRVLVLDNVVSVHKALQSRLLLPVRVRAVPGNGTVPAVAQSLWPFLQSGSSVDVVLAPMQVLEQLQAQSYVERGSLRVLISTPLALLVRAGRSVPRVADVDTLRQVLLQTRALAYSASDGATYIEQTLLPQLGIQREVLLKSIKAFGPQVAQMVVRGDAELGIQTLAELQNIAGISVVGELPAPLNYNAVYGVALASNSTTPEGAKALQNFYLREVAANDWHGTGWASEVPDTRSDQQERDAEEYAPR